MSIEDISFVAFRNLRDGSVTTYGRDVFLIGENGQGKTNFLEAVYYVCYGSSFKGSSDSEVVTRGLPGFTVRGSFSGERANRERTIRWEDGKKTLVEDGKRVADRAAFLSGSPVIPFNHADIELGAGEPEARRRFLDQTACLADPAFAETLRRYRKVLKMRNVSLREGRSDMLEVLDPQLVEYGIEVMKRRAAVSEDFNAVFPREFEAVARLGREVVTRYSPSWPTNEANDALAKLRERREADLEAGNTSSGPHRDRVRWMDGSVSFADFASTGQLRLLSLVQRIAQAEYARLRTGRKPVLLLDDVMLELDPERRGRFMERLPDYEQAFFTFLPGEDYGRYRSGSFSVYGVSDGRFSLQESR